jgi:hypothetical protein
MRIFILVLIAELFLVNSIAGISGVIGVIVFLVLSAAVMAVYHERTWRTADDCDAMDEDANPVTVFAPTNDAFGGLLAELDATVQDLLTTVLTYDEHSDNEDNDCDGEIDDQVKFLAMRRGRGQSWMGEADRRSLRLHPDNSWKRHRAAQWR